MRIFGKFAAAAVLAAALHGGANAATFDFTTNPGFFTTPSITTEIDGLMLDVTPGTYTPGPSGTFAPGDSYARITVNGSYGLGILTGWEPQGAPPNGQSAIDGLGVDEMMEFDFGDTIVMLTGLILNNSWPYGGTFDLFVDGILRQSNLSSFANITEENRMGSSFGIGANGVECRRSRHHTSCTYDAFKIEAISAVSVVPLPAALPLSAAATLLLGMIGWRNRRAASATA